jgi:hypothetical protein
MRGLPSVAQDLETLVLLKRLESRVSVYFVGGLVVVGFKIHMDAWSLASSSVNGLIINSSRLVLWTFSSMNLHSVARWEGT